ncbi:hypothetical protein EC9_11400 [Rosistilla ulvae]|uniref:Bacterial type II secretion system protein G n=1 Tax=Rosistilla ulvae TaxID=1930277 RepID=A0A517LWG5_9BACT|nr:hypothetical protein [Rosistilla ulvae]QDS86965.1 hypothetical protein EC9_11400 [Rosistilla ulvae]
MGEQKSKRGRNVAIALAAIGLAGFLIPCAGILTWRASSKAKLEKQLDRIRANGQPTTAAELSKHYVLPAGAEDTTQLWIDACTPLDTKQFSTAASDLPIVGADGPDEIPLPGMPWKEQAAVEQLLADYAESMQLMHQATAIGGDARFDHDFTRGIELQLPHVQSLRSGARMLKLEAHTNAHHGDAAACLQSLEALFTIGRAIENDPILVSQLVMIAMDGMAVHTTVDLLPHLQWNDSQLQRLQLLVRQPNYLDSVRNSLLGEQVFVMHAFENPIAIDGERSVLPGLPFFRAGDQALYLELMGDYTEGLKVSWSESFRAADSAQTRLTEATKSPIHGIRFLLTTLFFPALEAVNTAGARADSYAKLADVLIAAERYKLAKSEYPKTIEEMVPAYLPSVPIDPHDNAPVRYALRDGYPIAWCVGVDMVDDGGIGGDKAEPDVALTLNPEKED